MDEIDLIDKSTGRGSVERARELHKMNAGGRMDAKNPMLHGGNVAMLARRLGIDPIGIMDFSSNINPYGPPIGVVDAMRASLDGISEYPEPHAESFVAAVSASTGVPERNIVAGNGSIELIHLIAGLIPRGKAMLPVPSFTEYELALLKAGANVSYIAALSAPDLLNALNKRKENAEEAGMVMLGNPNNPCGYILDREDLLGSIDRNKETIWVVDEAFVDFVEGKRPYSLVNDVESRENLIVVKSLTKIYGLAGVRLGYAVAPTRISEKLHEAKYPWSVNTVAVEAGIASLREDEFIKETSKIISRDAERLYKDLSAIEGLLPFKPSANYILVKIEADLSAADLQLQLIKEGIAIRDCSSYTGLNENFFRLAVKRPEQNILFVSLLKKALEGLH